MACDPNYLSFSDAEYERRHAAVRGRMDRLGLEAVVFYGSRAAPDIHYLCNWLTTSEAYFIYPRQGEPTLFVQLSNHLPNARRMAIIDDVRFGGSSPSGSVDSVPRVLENLKDRGLEKGSAWVSVRQRPLPALPAAGRGAARGSGGWISAPRCAISARSRAPRRSNACARPRP